MSTRQLRRGLRFLGTCLVAFALWAAWASVAGAAGGSPQTGGATPSAATPVELPQPLTREALRDLLARLSDAEVRELLLKELDQEIVTAARTPEPAMMTDLEATTTTLRESWRRMFAAIPALPSVPVFFAEQLIGDRSPSILIWIVLGFAAIFAAGVLAEQLFLRVTREVRRQVDQARPGSAGARLGYCLLRALLDFVGIVIFVLATIAAFFVLHQGNLPVRLTVMTYVGAVFAIRLVALVSAADLAPRVPALRIVPVDDQAAGFLHRRIVRFAIAWALIFPTVSLLRTLGLDPDLAHLLGNLGAAVVVALLIDLIWQGRAPVARLIRGDDIAEARSAIGRARVIFARVWHVLAIVYVFAIWALAEVASALGMEARGDAALASLVLVIALPLADAALRSGIRGYLATKGGPEAAAYGRVAQRAGRILLIILAVVLFGWLWGINLLDFAAGGMGERALSAITNVGLTLLVAYFGWDLAKTTIDRRLAVEGDAAGPAEAGGEGGGRGASRLRTLLPLFRKFLMITLAVMVVMLVLSSLGVDIGPLLAGAGVVGLAIGFGAQTLVRDIVSGVFFLMDDAFRLGEYIDVGAVKGTVEHISIRSCACATTAAPCTPSRSARSPI